MKMQTAQVETIQKKLTNGHHHQCDFNCNCSPLNEQIKNKKIYFKIIQKKRRNTIHETVEKQNNGQKMHSVFFER